MISYIEASNHLAQIVQAIILHKEVGAKPEILDSLQIAVEAIEYQIPAKPENKVVAVCGECGMDLALGGRYCHQCGKKIDWRGFYDE